MPNLESASSSHDVAALVAQANAGRDPERLALKYKAIRASAFAFLRGTCGLYWSEAPHAFWNSAVPAAWACGDLHLENFGCYKGDDRQVRFDMNDFDEAMLAPCICDPVRLASSLLVGARDLDIEDAVAMKLCEAFLAAYADALRKGKAGSLDADSACGAIADLMTAASQRKRVELLDSRTELHAGSRRIRVDGKRALAVDAKSRAQVAAFMAAFAARQDNPEFFRLLDVARRIAGTGSLGVERYVLLVEGKGSPDRNYLLDLKRSQASAMAPFVTTAQPQWKDDATRIVSIQRRMQAAPTAFLHNVELGGKPFVLRGLQPGEDRLNLANAKGKKAKLQPVVEAMGQLLAWAQLRSSGWQGSANPGALTAFGADVAKWQAPLIELASNLARQVEADWRAFRDKPTAA